MTVHIGTPCLDEAFDAPEAIAARARRELAGVSFDTIVGTGFSGALVVPQLARDLGSEWLFVDDGIQTGATLARVRRMVPALAREYGQPTAFAGAYLYGHDRGTEPYLAPDHWIMREASPRYEGPGPMRYLR